jgi:hypothetical protein
MHDALTAQADEWAATVPEDYGPEGPVELLRVARSLYLHSPMDSGFLVAAMVMALQAVEAAFRLLLPEYDPQPTFHSLIERALEAEILTPEIAETMHSSRKLRNLLGHPMGTYDAERDLAARVIETSHYQVVGVMSQAGTLPTR